MDLATLRFTVETDALKDAIGVIDKMGEAAGRLNTLTKKLADAEDNFTEELRKSSNEAKQAANTVAILKKELELLRKQQDDNSTALKKVEGSLSSVDRMIVKAASSAEHLSKGFTAAQASQIALAQTMNATEKQLEQLTKAFSDQNAIKTGNKNLRESADAYDAVEAAIMRVTTSTRYLKEGFSSSNAKQLATLELMGATTEQIKQMKAALDDRSQYVSNPFDNSASALRGMVKEVNLAEGALQAYGNTMGLSAKQHMGLADDIKRLTSLMKEQGKSEAEIAAAVQLTTALYNTAAASIRNNTEALQAQLKAERDGNEAKARAISLQKQQADLAKTTQLVQQGYSPAQAKRTVDLSNQGYTDDQVNQIIQLETAAKRLVSVYDGIGKGIAGASKAQEKLIDSIGKSVEKGVIAFEKLENSVVQSKGLSFLSGSLNKITSQVINFGNSTDSSSKQVENLNKDLSNLEQLMQIQGKTTQEINLAMGITRGLYGATTAAIKEQEAALGALIEKAKRKAEQDRIQNTIDQQRANLAKTNDLMKQGYSPAQASRAVSLSNQGYSDSQVAEVMKMEAELKKLNDAYVGLGKGIQALTGAANNAVAPVDNVLKGILKGVSTLQSANQKFDAYVEKLESVFTRQIDVARSSESVSKALINQTYQIQVLGEKAGLTKEKITEIQKRIQTLGEEANAATKRTTALSQALNVMQGVLGALAFTSISQGIVDSVRGIITMTDSVTNFRNRLQSVTNESGNFGERFKQILTIANDARVPVESVGTLFTRLIPVMGNLGKTTTETLQVTKAFSSLLALSGANTTEASSALIQFSQAMGKGKLDGDEFRTITETIPGLMRLLTTELNLNEAALRKMSEEGKLTADMMVNVLGKNADELAEKIKGMQLTVSQSFTLLKNNFQGLIADSEKTQGSVALLADGIKLLANNLETVIGAVTFLVGLSFIRWLVNLVSYFKAAELAGGALTGVLRLFSVEVAAGSTALGTVGGLLTKMPGWLKLVGLAVTGAGAAWAFFSSSAEKESEKAEKVVKSSATIIEEKLVALKKKAEALGIAIKNAADEPTGREYSGSRDAMQYYDDLRKAQQEQLRLQNKLRLSGRPDGKGGLLPSITAVELGELAQAGVMVSFYTNKLKEMKAVQDKISKEEESNFGRWFSDNYDGDNKERRLKKEIEKANAELKGRRELTDTEMSAIRKKVYGEASDKVKAFTFANQQILENTNATETKKYEILLNSQRAQEQMLKSSLDNKIITEGEYAAQVGELASKSYGERNAALNAWMVNLNKSAAEEKKSYENQIAAYTGGDKKSAEAKAKLTEKLTQLTESMKRYGETVEKNLANSTVEYFKDVTLGADKAAKGIYTLKEELRLFNIQEEQLVEKKKRQTALEDQLRYASPEQVAVIQAQAAETERLTSKIEDFTQKYNDASLQVDIAAKAIELLTIEYYLGEMSIAEYGQQLATLNTRMSGFKDAAADAKKGLEDIRNGMRGNVLGAGNDALIKFNKEEQAKFSNSVADALETGLFEGSKAGSKKLRDILVAELRKPITIFIKAVVGDILGGGNGNTLSSLGNAASSLFSGDFAGAGKSIGGLEGIGKLKSLYDAFTTNISTSVGNLGTSIVNASGNLGAFSDTAFEIGASVIELGQSGFIQGLSGFNTLSANGVTSAASASGSQLVGLAAGTLAGALGSVSLTKVFSGEFKANGSQTVAAITGAIASYYLGPVVGSLIGSAIGTVINRAFGMGQKKIIASGIEGEFSNASFSGNVFQDWKQKGGWFRSDKKGTIRSDLDQATSDSLGQAFRGVIMQSQVLGSTLGLNTEALSKYTQKIKLVLTGDVVKDQEALEKLFNEMSDTLATKLVPEIAKFSLKGEAARDTLKRLSTNLTTVNGYLRTMGANLITVSVNGAASATALTDLFGGLDKFQSATDAYYEAFFTDAEKFLNLRAGLALTFASLNTAIPDSIESYKRLVQSLDLNTESGRALYATLIQSAPAFAKVIESQKEYTEGIENQINGLGRLQSTTGLVDREVGRLTANLVIQGNVSSSQVDQLLSLISAGKTAADITRETAASILAQGTATGDLKKGLEGLVNPSITLTEQQRQLAEAAVNAVDPLKSTRIALAAISSPGSTAGMDATTQSILALQSEVQMLGQASYESFVDTQAFVSAMQDYGNKINEVNAKIAGTSDIATRLSLENDLANLIKARYDTEFEFASKLQEKLQDVFTGITSERIAVRNAAIEIMGGPRTRSGSAIMQDVRSTNVTLPGSTMDSALAGLLAAQGNSASANSAVSGTKATIASINNLISKNNSVNSALINDAQAAINETMQHARNLGLTLNGNAGNGTPFMIQNGQFVQDWQSIGWSGGDGTGRANQFKDIFYGADRMGSAGTLFDRMYNLNSKVGANNNSNASLQVQLATETIKLAQQQAYAAKTAQDVAAAEQAVANARQKFADDLQKFAIDATKAKDKLSGLREETVAYYQAQLQLQQVMKTSAEGIRSVIDTIRFNDMNPQQQLQKLQGQFDAAFAAALTSTGADLAKQGDIVSGLINPILDTAKEVYASGADFENIKNSLLQQAEIIAGRLEQLAPQGFEQESLNILGAIDNSLIELQNASASAEKLIVEAINGSRDKTVEALRNVMFAIQGKPTNAFATGAAFTNGIVSRPTAFNMGVMGEAGPEAIMPLRRTSNGSLGVIAQGSSTTDNTVLVAELRQSNMHQAALVRVQQEGNKQIINRLEMLEDKLQGLEAAARLEAAS